jgi:hypothetical protein
MTRQSGQTVNSSGFIRAEIKGIRASVLYIRVTYLKVKFGLGVRRAKWFSGWTGQNSKIPTRADLLSEQLLSNNMSLQTEAKHSSATMQKSYEFTTYRCDYVSIVIRTRYCLSLPPLHGVFIVYMFAF